MAVAQPHHVVVVGASIAAGLGVRGRSYPDLLRTEHGSGIRVTNLAHSGRPLSETLQRIDAIIHARPDTVIVAHGSFESLFRPTGVAERLIPRRWRKKGWLDARPYFSRRLLKGTYQRIESAMRWRYKVLLIRAFGAKSWSTVPVFTADLERLVDGLLLATSARVLIISPSGADETFYPGSPAMMDDITEQMRQLCARKRDTGRVSFCDISRHLSRWSDFFEDRFHPNAAGHAKIADAVRASLGLERH